MILSKNAVPSLNLKLLTKTGLEVIPVDETTTDTSDSTTSNTVYKTPSPQKLETSVGQAVSASHDHDASVGSPQFFTPKRAKVRHQLKLCLQNFRNN